MPQSVTYYAEPSALHVDLNGDAWIDPEAFGHATMGNPRYNFNHYIEVRKTPPGLIVSLPSNGIWDVEPELDTTNLLPIMTITGRAT
jgi:hypothetical protein